LKGFEMFQCQECGKKFKTTAAAERASNNGCPKCGGCDIDLAAATPKAPYRPVTDPGFAAMMRDFDKSRRVED
jgi:predicted  nucleic acid-binding Zn-ribbon protein